MNREIATDSHNIELASSGFAARQKARPTELDMPDTNLQKARPTELDMPDTNYKAPHQVKMPNVN